MQILLIVKAHLKYRQTEQQIRSIMVMIDKLSTCCQIGFIENYIFYILSIKHYTRKPSNLRQALCASISFEHKSSPFLITHSSLAFFVSGQEQQILFPDFPTIPPAD